MAKEKNETKLKEQKQALSRLEKEEDMGKYDPLREFLENNRGDEVELTLKQIEIVIRDSLPASA